MSRLFPHALPDAWAIATIYGEARGEPFAGQRAVAEVIRNRMARRYFSDGTVAGTCLWPWQFSCWLSTDPNSRLLMRLHTDDPNVSSCIDAWSITKAGHEALLSPEAVLYHATTMVTRPQWAAPEYATPLLTLGHHTFYKPRSASGGGGEDAVQQEARTTPPAKPATKPKA